MSRRRFEDEEEWDGESWSDDADGDEEEATIPCPECNQPVHEDSPRCPSCGYYITDEDAPIQPKPWWIIVGSLLCLVVIYLWIVG